MEFEVYSLDDQFRGVAPALDQPFENRKSPFIMITLGLALKP